MSGCDQVGSSSTDCLISIQKILDITDWGHNLDNVDDDAMCVCLLEWR